MNKSVFLFFFLLTALPFSGGAQSAFWERTVLLKAGSGFQPDIAARQRILYAVYAGRRDDRPDIYLVQSSDEGRNWSAEQRIASSPMAVENLSVLHADNRLFVFWTDFREGNNEVYFTSSRDGRMNEFDREQNITRNRSDSIDFTVRASGENIFLVWADNKTGLYELYCKIYDVGKKRWLEERAVTRYSGGSLRPQLLTLMDELHLVWQQKDGPDLSIMYSRSSDGRAWSDPVSVSRGLERSGSPAIAATPDGLTIVFSAENSGQADIYSALYDVVQDKWTVPVPCTADLQVEKEPVLVSTAEGFFLFGRNLSDKQDGIFCIESHDRGLTWSSKYILSQEGETVKNWKVCPDTLNDSIYLIWEEGKEGRICFRSMDRFCPAPVITTASHKQDEWSSKKDIKIAWSVLNDNAGIRDFAYALDQNPETAPELFLAEYPVQEASFYNTGDGIWYFHLQARDRGGNVSAVTRYKIMINSQLYASSEKYYIIKYGDTLWDVAKKFFSEPGYYREIADYNQIGDPDWIYPHQILKIPPQEAVQQRKKQP